MTLKYIKELSLILALLILSGCNSYSSKFQCKSGVGLRCKSLSEINDLYNEGKLEEEIENQNGKKKKRSKSKSKVNSESKTQKNINASKNKSEAEKIDLETILDGGSNRQASSYLGEKKIEVRIAPYIDQNGDFNQERIIYTSLDD